MVQQRLQYENCSNRRGGYFSALRRAASTFNAPRNEAFQIVRAIQIDSNITPSNYE